MLAILAEIVFILVVTFVAFKLGPRAIEALILLAVLSFPLRQSFISRRFRAPVRFFFFAFLFLLIAMLVGNTIYYKLSAEAAMGSNALQDFLFGTQLLRVYWAMVGGIGFAFLLFAIFLLPTGYIGARAVLAGYEGYHGHEWNGAWSVISVVLGIGKIVQLVTDGRVKRVSPPAGDTTRFGGHGILIVMDGHAVVLERGGRCSRIVGHGVKFLEAFERVNMVVPLKSQFMKERFLDIPTKDGNLIKEFELLVFYQVDPGDAQPQPGSEFAFDEQNVRRFWRVFAGKEDPREDWFSAMKGISDNALRDVIARYNLDEIFVPSSPLAPGQLQVREKLKKEIKDQIEKITKPFLGVTTGADIGLIKIPEEAESKLLEKWMADWAVRVAESKKREAIAKGEADAEVLRAIENVRASAQNRMIHAIREAFDQAGVPGQAGPALVVILRFIEALEKMADEPSARVLFPYGLPLPELDKLWPLLAGGQGAEGVSPLLSPPTEAEPGPESPSD